MTEISYIYILHLIIIKRTTDLGQNGEVMKSDGISPFRILYYLIVVPTLIQFSKQVGLCIYQKFWGKAWSKVRGHAWTFFSDFLFDL